MRLPDWVLLVACALLMLAGPAMALQEWQAAEDARAIEEVTGRAPPQDAAFRAAWRLPLTALVFLVGAFGTWACIRTLGHALVRSVTRRLVALLLLGMTILDVAYVLDGSLFLDAPHALRALTLVWAYPLAGFLVAGSAHRLADVHARFGERVV